MSFPSWWGPLVRASVLAGTALLAGLLIGHPALTVALVLAAMLAPPQYMLERVRPWLRRRTDIGLRVDNLVRRPEFVHYLRSGEYTTPVVVQASGLSDQYLHFQIVPYGAGQLLPLVRDVTQQARLEEMRKDFVANASHQLRSPLTVISRSLETLSQA